MNQKTGQGRSVDRIPLKEREEPRSGRADKKEKTSTGVAARPGEWKQIDDHRSLYLIVFWHPKKFQIFPTPNQNNLFAGQSLQLMLIDDF